MTVTTTTVMATTHPRRDLEDGSHRSVSGRSPLSFLRRIPVILRIIRASTGPGNVMAVATRGFQGLGLPPIPTLDQRRGACGALKPTKARPLSRCRDIHPLTYTFHCHLRSDSAIPLSMHKPLPVSLLPHFKRVRPLLIYSFSYSKLTLVYPRSSHSRPPWWLASVFGPRFTFGYTRRSWAPSERIVERDIREHPRWTQSPLHLWCATPSIIRSEERLDSMSFLAL